MTVTRRTALLALLVGVLALSSCASGDNAAGRNARENTDRTGAQKPTTYVPTTAPAAPAGTTEPVEDVPGLAYQVGDVGPGGGIVFLATAEPFPCGEDLTRQCNYLEAAPGSSEVRRGWADVPRLEIEVEGADATELGAGWANTIDIIEQGNIDPITSAAAYAAAYEHNGQTDWYLPAKDEFNLLYEQRDVVGEFSGADYWSSSEVSANMAWSHYFHQGHPLLPHPKNHYTHLIRPIRAF